MSAPPPPALRAPSPIKWGTYAHSPRANGVRFAPCYAPAYPSTSSGTTATLALGCDPDVI